MKKILHIVLKPFYLRQKRPKQVRFSQLNVRTKLINPQFVTFLKTTRFKRLNLDKHERRLRRKTVWGRMALLIATLLFGWLIIESAQAISLF
ncbi:MAG: hypothetical protein O3C43_14130 [Verrucomicrobia bacterium]|nr:hypothetical protein [Verrucomicrobiota bacterium]MDA1067630.1 hypothetical protein [Verrucomicrobiota bacterium]